VSQPSKPSTLSGAGTACAAFALAALPFETERVAVHAGSLTLTAQELLLGAAIACTGLAALRSRATRPLIPDRAFAIAAGAFVAVLLVSSLTAPEHRINALKFSLRSAGGVAFGLAVCWLVRDRCRRAALLLGAFASGVAAASIVGLVEVAAGARLEPFLALFREHPIYVAGTRRVTASFNYPNTAAAAIAMALPTLAATLGCARGWRRVLALAGVLATVPILLLTYSRGGSIAALAGLLALGLFASRQPALGRVRTTAVVMALAVVGCWAAAARVDGLLAGRALGSSRGPLLAARVDAREDRLEVVAGQSGTMPVTVTNTGSLVWRSSPEAPYRLASSWYDVAGTRLDFEGPRADLPPVLAPGETVALDGAYGVPDHVGPAWLVWDIVIEDRMRMSEQGNAPGRVRAVIGRDAAEVARLAAAVGGGTAPPPAVITPEDIYAPPPRTELWRAALAIFSERPILGLGPDSYRLAYGRYLGLAKWDHRVYANNLALELLATTGLLGLAAFAWVTTVVASKGLGALRGPAGNAASRAALAVALAALAAFFAHGTVDYFLEFTVVYAVFWACSGIVVGLAAGARKGA
jgi:hypothetical protein